MYPRKVLTLSKIENTIHYANDFYDDGDIHRDLLLLADGFTLYYQDEINVCLSLCMDDDRNLSS